MTKKEICNNNNTIAYFSGYGGIELKEIEYGIDDYIYCVNCAWSSKKSYHKLKVKYTLSGNAYIVLNGARIPLNECIRT